MTFPFEHFSHCTGIVKIVFVEKLRRFCSFPGCGERLLGLVRCPSNAERIQADSLKFVYNL